jgi:hypothetical protein
MTDLEAVAERTWILTGSPENYAVTVSEHHARTLMEAMGERARTPA